MKVCGFSFLRNAVQYDYPFVQAFQSILPICDQIVVAVGNSTDSTLDTVRNIDSKITILETTWDDSQKPGGRVLALETDKAFLAIPQDYDWAFYIQGDEVVHEKYYPEIVEAMKKYQYDSEVDGLLFNYLHFFGSYDYVGSKYSWYRREIRVLKNKKDFFSYRDAQGFRKRPNDKLKVKLIDAYIYHYGWVRKPDSMQQKINANIHIYKGNNVKEQIKEMSKTVYDYNTSHQPVELFKGTHPNVMKEKIAEQNWGFQPDPGLKYASVKDRFKRLMFKYTNWYPGEYKNYKIIR